MTSRPADFREKRRTKITKTDKLRKKKCQKIEKCRSEAQIARVHHQKASSQ